MSLRRACRLCTGPTPFEDLGRATQPRFLRSGSTTSWFFGFRIADLKSVIPFDYQISAIAFEGAQALQTSRWPTDFYLVDFGSGSEPKMQPRIGCGQVASSSLAVPHQLSIA